MTLPTTARLAGTAYLTYLGAGIGSMALGPGWLDVASVVMAFSALALAVTLWALTRAVDPDIAMFAMLCRVLEAAPGQGELWFAVGNALFCWLMLKGRVIPALLAWIGLVASSALAALVLAQTAGMFGGRMQWSSPVTWFVWLPVLVFELAFAVLLLSNNATPAAGAAQAAPATR